MAASALSSPTAAYSPPETGPPRTRGHGHSANFGACRASCVPERVRRCGWHSERAASLSKWQRSFLFPSDLTGQMRYARWLPSRVTPAQLIYARRRGVERRVAALVQRAGELSMTSATQLPGTAGDGRLHNAHSVHPLPAVACERPKMECLAHDWDSDDEDPRWRRAECLCTVPPHTRRRTAARSTRSQGPAAKSNAGHRCPYSTQSTAQHLLSRARGGGHVGSRSRLSAGNCHSLTVHDGDGDYPHSRILQ
ncbi:hypothetical protein NA57DRAFT_61591 [Rhizodiscina lignyota]|uniref:Uncharacterized protein n=1 Tax=Rhizodiscina lignyota TaxID=1504668 RepID=A0A9P4M0C3_9PEZI|nr:hypothetical protein NA57DRAFT_61591 [Rhizodiscina lignyota]